MHLKYQCNHFAWELIYFTGIEIVALLVQKKKKKISV